MICKFCRCPMNPVDIHDRVLVCENCGYFETNRTPLSTSLEYPQLKTPKYPGSLLEAYNNGAL